MSKLTPERLRELLDYYPQRGIFVWRVGRAGKARAGTVAGSKNGAGYIHIRINGHRYTASRLAWFYMTGVWPPANIDHKDRNRSNDSIFNLRLATYGQNRANTAPHSVSGCKGVTWQDGKWRARIKVNGWHINLGYFESIESAADAYATAARHYWGEFAHIIDPMHAAGSQNLESCDG